MLLYALAALLYLVLAALVWRARIRGGVTATVLRIALLVPLTLHGLTLYQGFFGGDALRFGFGHALSVMLWLAVALYWLESFFLRLDGLLAITLPLAALAALLPAVFGGFVLRDTTSVAFRLHIVAAMAAYSLFTIAMLQAALMAALERRLHSIRQLGVSTDALAGPLATLPPLLTLERVLFRLIGAGFVLLTLTLLSGILFSEQVFGRALRLDHKTLFAILSWFIFAGLLIGRWRAGWRGRIAQRWIFAGFATLLLAYVGSRFVLEVVLQRTVH
ncbi:MAG: cytochrome c biogenesis protein CcsA [Burkholderiales bacterium]